MTPTKDGADVGKIPADGIEVYVAADAVKESNPVL